MSMEPCFQVSDFQGVCLNHCGCMPQEFHVHLFAKGDRLSWSALFERG